MAQDNSSGVAQRCQKVGHLCPRALLPLAQSSIGLDRLPPIEFPSMGGEKQALSLPRLRLNSSIYHFSSHSMATPNTRDDGKCSLAQ